MDLRVLGLIVISYNVVFGQREFTMETMFGEVPTPLLAMAAQGGTGMASDATGGIAIGGMTNQAPNAGQSFAPGGNMQLFGATGPVGRQVQSKTAPKAVAISGMGVGVNTKAGSGEFVNEAFTALGNVGHLVKKEAYPGSAMATGIDATDASRYPTFGASVDSVTAYTNAENPALSLQNTASVALPTVEHMPANASAPYFFRMLARNVLDGQNAMNSPSLNAILSAIVSRNLKPGSEMNAGLLFLRNALLGSSGDMNSANLSGLRTALRRIASNSAFLQNASEIGSFSPDSKIAAQPLTAFAAKLNINAQDGSFYQLPTFTPLGSTGSLSINMLKHPTDINEQSSNQNTNMNMNTASISMANYNDKSTADTSTPYNMLNSKLINPIENVNHVNQFESINGKSAGKASMSGKASLSTENKLSTADSSIPYNILNSKLINPIENVNQFETISGKSALSDTNTISGKASLSIESNNSGVDSTRVPISSSAFDIKQTLAIGQADSGLALADRQISDMSGFKTTNTMTVPPLDKIGIRDEMQTTVAVTSTDPITLPNNNVKKDQHTSAKLADTASLSMTNTNNHNIIPIVDKPVPFVRNTNTHATISPGNKPVPFGIAGALKTSAIDMLAPIDTSRSMMTFHDSSKLTDVDSKSVQMDSNIVPLTGETVPYNSLGTERTTATIKQDTNIQAMKDTPSISLADSNSGTQSIAERFPYRWIDNRETNSKVDSLTLSDTRGNTKTTSERANTASMPVVKSNAEGSSTVEFVPNSFVSTSETTSKFVTKPQTTLSEKGGMQNNINMASTATLSLAGGDQGRAIDNKPHSQNVLDTMKTGSIQISAHAGETRENPMMQLDSKFADTSSISVLNNNRDAYLTDQSTPYELAGGSVTDRIITSTPLGAASEMASMTSNTKTAGTASLLIGKADSGLALADWQMPDASGIKTTNTMTFPSLDNIGIRDKMQTTVAVTSKDPITHNAHTHSAFGSMKNFGIGSSAMSDGFDGKTSMQGNTFITRKASVPIDNKDIISSLPETPISDPSTKHFMGPFLHNLNVNTNMHDTNVVANYVSPQHNTNSLDPIIDSKSIFTSLNNHLHGMNQIRTGGIEHGSKGVTLTHAGDGDASLSSGKAQTVIQPDLHTHKSFASIIGNGDINNRRFGFGSFSSRSDTIPPPIESPRDFTATPSRSITIGSSFDTSTFKLLPSDTDKKIGVDISSIDSNINRLHAPSSSVASSGFSDADIGKVVQSTGFNIDSSILPGRPLETILRKSDRQQIHSSTLFPNDLPSFLPPDQTIQASLNPDRAGHAHVHVQDMSAQAVLPFDAVTTGSNIDFKDITPIVADASKPHDQWTKSPRNQHSEGQSVLTLISESNASTMDTHANIDTPKNSVIPMHVREFATGHSARHNLPSVKTSFADMDTFPNPNSMTFGQGPVTSTAISLSNEQPVPTSIGHTDFPQKEIPLKPFKEAAIFSKKLDVPKMPDSPVFLNVVSEPVNKDLPNTASNVDTLSNVDTVVRKSVSPEQTVAGNEFSFTQSSRRIPFEDLGVSNDFHLPHGSFVIGAGRPNSKVISTGLGLDPFTDSSGVMDGKPIAEHVPTDTNKQQSKSSTLPGWHITDSSKVNSAIPTANVISDLPATPASQTFDSVHIETTYSDLGTPDSIPKPMTVYDIPRNVATTSTGLGTADSIPTPLTEYDIQLNVDNFYLNDNMHANIPKSKNARSDIDIASYRDLHADPVTSMAHVNKGQDGVVETPYSTFTVVPKLADIFVSEPEVVSLISGSSGAPITNLMGARVQDTVSMNVDTTGAATAVNSVKSSKGMPTNEAVVAAGENKGSIITKTPSETAAISNSVASQETAQSVTNKETTSTGGGIAISFGNMGGMGINERLSSVAFSTSPSSTTHETKSSSAKPTPATNLLTTTNEVSTAALAADGRTTSIQTSTTDGTTQSVFTTTSNTDGPTTTGILNISTTSENVTPAPNLAVAAINLPAINAINKQAIATNTNDFTSNVALQYLVPAENSKSFYKDQRGADRQTVFSKVSSNDQLGAGKQAVVNVDSGWRPKSMPNNFLGFTVSPNRDAPGIPSTITDHSKVIDLKANSADVRSSFTSLSETTVPRDGSAADGQFVRTPIVGNVFGSSSNAQPASLTPDQIVLSREPEVDFMTSFLSGVSSSASRPDFTVGKSVRIIPIGQTKVVEDKSLTSNSAPGSTSTVDRFGVADIYTRQQQLNPEQWSKFMTTLSQDNRINSWDAASQNRINAGGVKVPNIDYLTQNVVGASDVRSFADQNLINKQQSDMSKSSTGTDQMKMTSSQWSDGASGLTSATSSSGTSAIDEPLRKLQQLHVEQINAMKSSTDQTGQFGMRTAFEAPGVGNPRAAMFGNDQITSGAQTASTVGSASNGLNIVTSAQTDTKSTLSEPGQSVLFQGSSVTGSLRSSVPAYDTVSSGSSNNQQNTAGFKVQTSEFTTSNQNMGANRISVPGATEQMNWETIKKLIGQGKITLQMNADQLTSAPIVPFAIKQDLQDTSRRNVNGVSSVIVSSSNQGQIDSANVRNNQDMTGDFSSIGTFTAAALRVGQPIATGSETFKTSHANPAIGGSAVESQSSMQMVTNNQVFDTSNTMGTSGTAVAGNEANMQSVTNSGTFDATGTNIASVGSVAENQANTQTIFGTGAFDASRTDAASGGSIAGSRANTQSVFGTGAFDASRTDTASGGSIAGNQPGLQTVIDSGSFDASKAFGVLGGSTAGSRANMQTTGSQSAITTFRTGFAGSQSGIRNVDFSSQTGGKATQFTSGNRPAFFGSSVHGSGRALASGQQTSTSHRAIDVSVVHECRYTSDPNNENYFYMTIGDVRHRLRCALGTAFDPLTCECSKRVSDTGDCLEVHMDFNNGKVEDSSINRLPIANQNVEVTNKSTPLTGIALFGRDSKLTIWRYQNYDFRDHIMLKVQFRPGPGGDPLQPLISNCDGGQGGPSVAILYDSKLKEVRLILQTDNDTKKELIFPVNADVWNDVTYIYDGQEFIGIVNGVRRYVSRQDPHLLGIIGGEIKSKPTRGLIEIRDGAIVLGHCPQFGYYTGAMVDIQIYTCIPKDFRLE